MSVISNVCCNGGTFEFKLKYPLHWGPRRQIGPDQARARARSSQTSQLLVLRGFNSGRGRGSASPVLSPRSALGSPRLRGFWVYVSEQRLETRGAGHHQSWLCKLLAINQTIKHRLGKNDIHQTPDTIDPLYDQVYVHRNIWILGIFIASPSLNILNCIRCL